jgi:hypothetical protein
LSYRDGAKAALRADEPEAIEEALWLQRPGWSVDPMDCGEMLCEGAEICIVALVSGRQRALGDGLRARVIVPHEGELVEKLTHGVAKVLSLASTACHSSQRLTQTRGGRGV